MFIASILPNLHRSVAVALAAGLMAIAGCSQPTMFANPDPSLRKSVPELKEDSATRFPYKADAPRALEPKARALVGYDLHRVEVLNFTGEDWSDVEVWVNREYVCYVPKMESRKLKEIHYPMLYNELGQSLPFSKSLVRTVEIYRNGTMYQIACHPVDF
jgi:hypothetical protein